MDFFQAQDDARQRTRVLIALFAAAIVAIVVCIYIVVALVAGLGLRFEPGVFLAVVAGVALVVGGGSTYRTMQLRQGGPSVAAMLGGRAVDLATTDADERKLLNVVEEMAIASGVPVPAVFVLPEESINAFAAGYGIHDAAVAVTYGALRHLTRDELQGVIAHEFSHILNGDMRLNIRLIGLLHGLLVLVLVGRVLLRSGSNGSSSRRGKKGGGGAQIALVGLALVILGYIGVLFGKLIKAAASRQREFLADAAAVQFTRNPEGIAGALKKIGALGSGSRIRHPRAEELSHLYFASGLKSGFAGMFATHPPLEERIRRIDPSFDGSYAGVLDQAAVERVATESAAQRRAAAGPRVEPRTPLATMRSPMDLGALIAAVGALASEHLDFARQLVEGLPAELRSAAHSKDDAPALVFALLLAAESEADAKERDAVRSFGGDELLTKVDELVPLVRAAGQRVRLPLLDMALPALRRLGRERSAALGRAVRTLILADGSIKPLEFAVYRVLARELGGARARAAANARAIHSLAALRDECAVVLSALAYAGARDEADAHASFDHAVKSLPSGVGELRIRPAAEAGLDAADRALERLAHGSPGVRRRFLVAAGQAIAHDRILTPDEVELFRAVAEALDCPVPPMLATATLEAAPAPEDPPAGAPMQQA